MNAAYFGQHKYPYSYFGHEVLVSEGVIGITRKVLHK
ncbi:hypothetical protein Pan161_49280 [Gimesia algae]|uniref:Uncharacterized protein n=1 Tax=Gimesia algae TaxID=2527971 RepID=A0A517VJQ8_9PLAN|nr:hypothetical protein Pan161_49280 [Gimesia algae]